MIYIETVVVVMVVRCSGSRTGACAYVEYTKGRREVRKK